ncbi:MAG TPA: DUF2339 domain-containing protein [Balneolaceae bacterium]|nr:DUF2339 domain-containing protein [Balneolaceae bacterium]
MPNADKNDLQARITRLEQRVEELEQLLEEQNVTEVKSPSAGTREKSALPSESSRPRKQTWTPRDIQPGEQWLNRIGIGLLLIGIAFLFKYSIDQGWLIPPVRSAIGLGMGLVLFLSGLQMQKEDTPMKQILLGGGISTFYITGFATFQLYSFASGFVIWPFMIIVTLLALSLSLQQSEAVLSVIGTLGALGTPFMLYTGSGSVVMLMLYTALVLVGTGIVYFFKGWKALLWSITAGGFVVMCVGVVNTAFAAGTATSTERWALVIGTVIWGMSSWILATGRAMLTAKNPQRWPDHSMVLKDGNIDPNMNFKPGASVHLLVFLVPLFIMPLMIGIWNLSQNGTGIVAFALAGIGTLGYLALKAEESSGLASTHIFMSLVMLTIGLILLLEGNVLFTVLAAEAIALRYIAYQTDDEKVNISSHILFGIVILWLINLMRFSIGASPTFNIEGVQLAFISAGGLLLPLWLKREDIRLVYRVVCHILFLFWIYKVLSFAENGQAWVTVGWCIYGVLLLVLGFIRFGRRIRLAGMTTIFIVVGKLFLVDLSQLQAIWRILLFIGFGIVFLLLGYYWQRKMGEENSDL